MHSSQSIKTQQLPTAQRAPFSAKKTPLTLPPVSPAMEQYGAAMAAHLDNFDEEPLCRRSLPATGMHSGAPAPRSRDHLIWQIWYRPKPMGYPHKMMHQLGLCLVSRGEKFPRAG